MKQSCIFEDSLNIEGKIHVTTASCCFPKTFLQRISPRFSGSLFLSCKEETSSPSVRASGAVLDTQHGLGNPSQEGSVGLMDIQVKNAGGQSGGAGTFQLLLAGCSQQLPEELCSVLRKHYWQSRNTIYPLKGR